MVLLLELHLECCMGVDPSVGAACSRHGLRAVPSLASFREVDFRENETVPSCLHSPTIIAKENQGRVGHLRGFALFVLVSDVSEQTRDRMHQSRQSHLWAHEGPIELRLDLADRSCGTR